MTLEDTVSMQASRLHAVDEPSAVKGHGAESAVAEQRRGVLVLGMHRSGTSAVAGLLANAGFCAGEADDLMPADGFNEFGYFERHSVLELDDGLLAQAGGSWRRPPAGEELVALASERVHDVAATLARVTRDSGGRPVVVKDPRICVLLPIWKPFVGGMLQALIVTRNPLDTARSLARRDGMMVTAALALWEVHLSAILDSLAGEAVHVVSYERLLADETEASALIQRIAMPIDPRTLTRGDDGAQIDRSLVHYHSSVADFESRATSHQVRLWRFIQQLPSHTTALEVPDDLRRPTAAALERIREEDGRLDRLETLRGASSSVMRIEEALRGAQMESDQRAARVAELETELDRAETQVAELGAAAARATQALVRCDEMERVVVDLLERYRERAEACAIEEQRAEALQGDLAQMLVERDTLMHDVHNLNAALHDVRTSETWKVGRVVTAPGRAVVRLFRRR